MDRTLVDIINEWIATQQIAKQLQQENAQLKERVAELEKPKAEVMEVPTNGAVSQPLVDTQVVAEQSA